ncbi:sensor histidine kinase [Brevibacterium jeotgali]|uniref:Signal transduction histidine kinase n=1 Tax=Brevibacterium jeotgali TaxID=1262550 RepID=A0A2H1L8S2_9MICO|nr:histidine kinase [Brevibacterium jeotgali]TWB98550.1 signal transduction histidine kinase [Brevibacterium jeotgali]SMY13291.1 Signal transduction histidine kinase [Brevibacterium jeotgali]
MTWAPGQVLMQAGKVVLFMRLLCSLPVVLAWSDQAPTAFQITIVSTTTGVSLVLILAWSRVVPFIMRHPATVIVDVGLSTGLIAAAGVDSPYVAYLFCGALLVGMLFAPGARTILSTLIISAFLAESIVQADLAQAPIGIGAVSVSATIITVLVCVHMGATLRTLQWRVDSALEVAARNARDAALGEERSRLARELHDSLTKTLVGIGLQAAALRLRHPESTETASRISAAANDAVDQSRAILTDLREGSGACVAESLRSSLAEVGTLYGIHVRSDISDQSAFVSDPAVYVVRKITEEAVINAAKHARVDTVDVTVRTLPGWIVATVADEGTGMRHRESSDGVGHYGLTGMKERAAAINGRVGIESKPGAGTTITITAPLEGAEQHG